MRFCPSVCVVVAVSLFAGCASPDRRSSTAPVWEDLNTVVPPSPVFPIAGPVETNASVPVRPAVSPKPSPGPVSASETWIPLQRWSHANAVGSLIRLTSAPAPSYALQTPHGAFVFHTGSQLSQWEGLEVRLGFAPQLIDGQPYVHWLDLNKTIQPLVRGEPAAAVSRGPVVVIDPGHGGENAGAKSVLGNRYEKEFTLDWALRLQTLLQAANCKVLLTRSNDSDLALSNRVAFAVSHKADLFISLHFNSAAPNETESGLETYCLTPAGLPSNLTRGFADEIGQTFPNNAYDVPNLFLALRVHHALLQVNGHHDRGIRRARFPGVLRGQECAAILVEGGYLSNPQEARLIAEPEYRQKLAEAVAKALLPAGASVGNVAVSSNAVHLQAGDGSADSASKGTPGPEPDNRGQ